VHGGYGRQIEFGLELEEAVAMGACFGCVEDGDAAGGLFQGKVAFIGE